MIVAIATKKVTIWILLNERQVAMIMFLWNRLVSVLQMNNQVFQFDYRLIEAYVNPITSKGASLNLDRIESEACGG